MERKNIKHNFDPCIRYIDHIFVTDSFVMDKFRLLGIDHSFLIDII